MQISSDLDRRIAELAAFLDPVAFEHGQDRSLAKRRDAAWREAANRIRSYSIGREKWICTFGTHPMLSP
ncbi:hypothetical protein DC522_32780 [Microvirga sp. KLBC 81]|nr:hypothetical protein DC522_32780 [Microvirga sp. KLBC 81]